jgi:eukaryotic-like serine/threonine-protein kinase
MKSFSGEFAGNDRFAVRRRLGSGGHGIVYEVFDRERASTVALKALGRKDPSALLRFKYEFRALADLSHPNLVALYELLTEADEWFLTMELVRGSDFLSYVWHFEGDGTDRGPSPLSESPTASSLDVGALPKVDDLQPVTFPRHETPADMSRLSSLMHQLGTGLRVLHDAGKLHRDIKPSNVLVTPEGRVKILDFGLVKELGPARAGELPEIAGTPAYMSPEQAAGLTVSSASDWYSVGALLYEALTGQRPFHGGMAEVLARKQRQDAVAPRELVTGVPAALDELCVALLDRDPARRASWPQVAAAVADAVEQRPHDADVGRRTSPFIGREAAMSQLRGALDEVRGGESVLVALHGPSGMGKSMLVRQFLAELAREEGVIVLESCCYSQEAVPYKAIDGLVDGLCEHVRRLPAAQALELLPHDLPALARLFPVLGQFLSPSETVHEVPDLQELRRRAARALRELLSDLGEKVPLVVFIDDLQWGDADSAPLLLELLAGATPPRMLLVIAYRSEDAGVHVLQQVLGLRGSAGSRLRFRDIAIGELTLSDARGLARSLVGDRPDATAQVELLARESAGNPFFLLELAHSFTAEAAPQSTTSGETGLGTLIDRRVERLGETERRLLEILSVAAEPIARRVAADAAGVGSEEPAVLARLRAAHLLRDAGTSGYEDIATYHDRIRETVVAGLAPDVLRARHGELAQAMERSTRPDPERMSIHFRGAGDLERAARYAIDAAARASQALAFGRAARLYNIALEPLAPLDPRAQPLRLRLAEALANAGRSHEAAEAYLAAAHGANDGDAVEWRRCAAEQFLRGGYADDGMIVLRSVLDAFGLKLPRSRPDALARLLMTRLWIRLRGIGYTPRTESELSVQERTRIDACWSVTFCLGFVDLVMAGYLQARHMLWALKAGEPYRIALALAAETAYSSPGGSHTEALTARRLERASRLAEQVNRPHSTAIVLLTAGLRNAFLGRWRESAEKSGEAERLFRERCTGVAHELANSIYWRLFSVSQGGALRALRNEVPLILKDAQERGDLYLGTNVNLRVGYLLPLADDDPAAAFTQLDRAIAGWTFGGISNQHNWEMLARVQGLIYSGDGLVAFDLFERRKSEMRTTLTVRVQLFRILAAHARGRAAVAGALSGATHLLREARRSTARIRRERRFWGDPLADLVDAGAASCEDRRAEMESRLRSAVAGLEAAEMRLYAAAARRCLGKVVGGDEGEQLVGAAETWMRGEAIRNPERMTAMLAPGRWARA